MPKGAKKALTSARKGIRYAHAKDPENPAQNMVEYLDISGVLQFALLGKAFGQALTEVKMSRSRFGQNDDDVGAENPIHGP